jgi:beta-1,4-mannosyl-glycoprotein beta-1,4-N-acetylglucosaminyltransferase
MLNYRLHTLDNVVDYFILVEANRTHVGKLKELYFENNKHLYTKFLDKIIHIVVDDFPHTDENIDTSKGEQWINEKYQRNCIKRGLEKIQLNNDDIIIIADVDEIPDPDTLKDILFNNRKISVCCLEQDFYYYNLNSLREEKWYHSKMVSYETYKKLNKECDELRFTSGEYIKYGGWHLSYFGSPDFIKNKIENFTHQEHNNVTNTNINMIQKRISECTDIYGRGTNMIFVEVDDNPYLPPLYNSLLTNFYKPSISENIIDIPINTVKNVDNIKKVCFIHSCHIEKYGTKRLDYLIEKIISTRCIDNLDKVIINNIGVPILTDYGEKFELINYSEDISVNEKSTLNKVIEFSQNNPETYILYLHTKGISILDKINWIKIDNVNDWIDMMIYFNIERQDLCVKILNNSFDTVGCNYMYPKGHFPHYSGNFWWANSNYLKDLEKLPENEVTHNNSTEFLLFTKKPNYYNLHTSGLDHYVNRYARTSYAD